VHGLQAADTLHARNDDRTIQPRPGSTRINLPAGTSVKLSRPVVVARAGDKLERLPDGTEVSVRSAISINVDDGLRVTLEDGTATSLPGALLTSAAGAMRVTRADATTVSFVPGARITLSKDTPVRLPSGAAIKLADGEVVALPDDVSVALSGDTQAAFLGALPRPKLYEDTFFRNQYKPSELVRQPFPLKELDFSSSGAYAVYNWELFFHVPMTIAIHLSKNQRYEEAQQWLHYVFDPTDDSDGPTPERFWKVKPFQHTDAKLIEDIIVNLSTRADQALRDDTISSIQAWKNKPFRPHLVARYRQTAYMFKAVMAYLDNLVAWGDSLFRQDTGESINEATQLYVLAANILGPRPQPVPKKGPVRPQTYASVRKDLSDFGNVLVDLESNIPFDLAPHPGDAGDIDRIGSLHSVGQTLYFCVPRNDKLLGYWDTIADRWFKIRNSLNIQGIFRQLPLFEPPIDPALLARAVAAGLDVSAIVSGLNQPLPLVRFQFLVQKALELSQEVKSLGSSFLSAMEKEDSEALAILRARHERNILEKVETIRYAQWQEAIKTRESLTQSILNAAQRYQYYGRLLGRDASELQIPELEELDVGTLNEKKLKANEPSVEPREIKIDVARGANVFADGRRISGYEMQELMKLEDARVLQITSATMENLGSLLALIPQFKVAGKPIGIGSEVGFGGLQISRMFSGMASAVRIGADQLSHEASKAAKLGSYARREQEWAFQSNLAAGEITQIFKQLRAAQIREAIAEREWANHQKQIRNAEEIEYFLSGELKDTDVKGKKPDPSWRRRTTTEALYAWMKREVRGLYGQCFQFAFDVAKKAERALQHELGNPELTFVQFGHLAGKEGLLAGEKLYFDLKRMEMAYHDLNQREYELTKHVSLLQVSPLALLQLRATGTCTVSLPEELFDMDGPGHYFRRIKSVAVSIPCVTGPYSSVNCRLSLLKSSIRIKPSLNPDYGRDGSEDGRFSDHFGSLQTIVTSSGQNDSGMFETNLRDERYLPFESSGCISEWQLELPANPSKKEPCQFDYDTISDVILHVRYTAREGGSPLRKSAVENLNTQIGAAQAAGSIRLFSVRHECPTVWSEFKRAKIDNDHPTARVAIELGEKHFPFWSQGRVQQVNQVELFAKAKDGLAVADAAAAPRAFSRDDAFGNLWTSQLATMPAVVKGPPLSIKFDLDLTSNALEELWFALTWGEGG